MLTSPETVANSITQVAFKVGDLAPHLASRMEAGSESYAGRAKSDNAFAARVARRDLGRYYDLLRASCPQFDLPEALLLCDALNGVASDLSPRGLRLFVMGVADFIEERGAGGCDGEALLLALRALKPFETAALLDAVERFWLVPGHLEQEGSEETLRRVGLVAP